MTLAALLPYVERELIILRGFLREFYERYPALAGNLQIAGDVCEDPHIEHLIQAVALIGARISKRMDDDYPQFTEALFETLFPHYLRPFPSCAIVQVLCTLAHNEAMTTATVIARGTEMESALIQGVRCKFTTAYDVALAPIALTAARFDAVIDAPASAQLPASVSSSLSIVIEGTSAAASLGQLVHGPLRVFINGEPSFCSALRDALFMRTVRAFVELENGEWRPLATIPLAQVGFAETDALIPFGARSHQAYRVLTEYFAFPEKFNFFDIDLAAIHLRLPENYSCITLHLAMDGVRPDSQNARLLRSLSPTNLLLSCTPVVNLFQRNGVPIAVTHFAADYSVLAHPTNASAFEVYSIDSVHVLRQRENHSVVTEFRQFYSLRHSEGETKKGHYWVLRHDEALAQVSPGHEKRITLVDADFEPLAIEKTSLSIELTCTNRELPGMLKYGQPGGDLLPLAAANGSPMRFLRRPSQPYRFDPGFGLHWRLISHLTLNHHSLAQEGLAAFREMLVLYDLPQSPVTRRQINGIVGLDHVAAATWRRHKRGASLVHGTEVRITLDEEAFVGNGMHLFVQVIDQFLGLYVQLNSFIELVILSKTSGEELIRCKPRSGSVNLV